MKSNSLMCLWLVSALALPCGAQVETSFQPVAMDGQPASGIAANVFFGGINSFSLANDGQVAFTANLYGSGVTSTNNEGVWMEFAGDLNLMARTGDPVPGTNDFGYFTSFGDPNNSDLNAVSCGAEVSSFTNRDQTAGIFGVAMYFKLIGGKGSALAFVALAEFVGKITENQAANIRNAIHADPAARVELSGQGIGPTNNVAIAAGPSTNLMIVAQTGSPAPGSSGNFSALTSDEQSMVLAPDGSVAFEGEADGVAGIGLWFGQEGAVQPVALPGSAAPDSLLGAGYTWSSISSSVEVNGSDELAYAAYLSGPGLNATNSEFVVAGPPDAPRVIAQSGQPAPGIPGAFFQSVPGWGLGFGGNGVDYEHDLIGPDGAVAFVATYSTNENNYGLWLAPTNGVTPILIMHTGEQAPGTPPGVVFTNFFEGLPPFGNVFMNGRDEIVFLSMLTGPGVGSTNNVGIWQAEPDGTVNLVARSGDTIDVGGGVLRQIQISYLGGFGNDAPLFSGPEDGRPRLFNNRGQILFQANGSLFIAQTGIVISAELSGNDVLLHFPTLTGKNYEVDYKTNLSAASWSVAVPSVAGTGGKATVTNSVTASPQTEFYRVVRTD